MNNKFILTAVIILFILLLVDITGLNARWEFDIFSPKLSPISNAKPLNNIEGRDEKPLSISLVRESTNTINGVITSLKKSERQLIIDISFGLENTRTATVVINDNTHIWKAAVEKVNGSLIYYRQPFSFDQLKIRDILLVEAKEWYSYKFPGAEVLADSVGMFDKVLPNTKTSLLLRYGQAAEKIKSY